MDKLSDDFLQKIYALMRGDPTGVIQGGDGGDGSMAYGPTPTYYGTGGLLGWNANQHGIAQDTGDGHTNNYQLDGTFRDRTANTGGNYYAKQLGKGALAAAAMYGGANFLNNNFLGADALGGAGAEAAGMGGGGLDSVGLRGFDALPAVAQSGAPITGSVAPLSVTEFASALVPSATNIAAGASGLQAGMSALNPTGGGFFSDPRNLLSTAGAIGSIVEGLRDPPSTDTKTDTTRKFDPKVQEALFGSGGAIDRTRAYIDNAAANNFNNPTMDMARSRMGGLVSDPRLWESLYSNAGMGVNMVQNPWLKGLLGGSK